MYICLSLSTPESRARGTKQIYYCFIRVCGSWETRIDEEGVRQEARRANTQCAELAPIYIK